MDLPSKTLNDRLKSKTLSGLTYENQRWYSESYVERVIDPKEERIGIIMEPGKIYSFIYDPITPDLEWYDNCPISLNIGGILTKGGRWNAMGINLSFIPPQVRGPILDKIVKVFDSSVIKPNMTMIEKRRFHSLKHMQLQFDICKKILAGSGMEFAIRSYRYDRMYTEPRIITYEDWWRLLTFGSKFIRLVNSRAIYYKYLRAAGTTHKRKPVVIITKTKIKDVNDYLKKRNKK